MTKKDEEEFVLHGDLTIRGVTKSVDLNATRGGTVTDPYGQVKAGFEPVGKISLRDFGLTWNVITEAGGAVVSDEVRLIVNVQIIRQA